MFTDTHAHLGFPEFADDLPAVLARAAAAGVSRIVSIATGGTAERTLAIAAAHPGVFAALGVHPTELPERGLADLDRLRPLFAHPQVVAVGETGLDYYHRQVAVLPSGGRGSCRAAATNAGPAEASGSAGASPSQQPVQAPTVPPSEADTESWKQLQRDLFQAHLDLGLELGRPVIIHNRSADTECLAVVRAHAARVPAARRPWGVMHCFAGDTALARECLALGLLVSFTGILTFKNAARLREVAAALPLAAVMLETDCPYLAPAPHRGRRNEPAHIPLIAAALATIKAVPVAEVARVTSATAARLFGWGADPTS